MSKERLTGVKILNDKVKKIGIRSISDIINNTPELSFEQKVNYIRHVYTYYEGNYEYFYKSKGKPNSKKFELNNLIKQILKGEKDFKELKAFNENILAWRKEYEAKRLSETEKFLSKFSPVNVPEPLPFWKQSIINNIHDNPYIPIIEKFLQSDSNNLTKEQLETITYQKLKNLAIAWQMDNLENASVEYDNRVTQSINEKLRIKQEKEDKRVYELMKQYAIDLGYGDKVKC